MGERVLTDVVEQCVEAREPLRYPRAAIVLTGEDGGIAGELLPAVVALKKGAMARRKRSAQRALDLRDLRGRRRRTELVRILLVELQSIPTSRNAAVRPAIKASSSSSSAIRSSVTG